MAVIPRLPLLYDEPFADSSQVPTFLVASLARQHVTVSLSGDGGDEIFGGYNRYFLGERLWRNLQRVPAAGRQLAASAVQRVRPDSWDAVLTPLRGILPAHLRRFASGDRIHKLADVLQVAIFVREWANMSLEYKSMPGCVGPDKNDGRSWGGPRAGVVN